MSGGGNSGPALGPASAKEGGGGAGGGVAGAGAGGVAEGVFVGDVEGIGTFGDLLGGPTEINREEDQKDPARQLVNRIKFGTDNQIIFEVDGEIKPVCVAETISLIYSLPS